MNSLPATKVRLRLRIVFHTFDVVCCTDVRFLIKTYSHLDIEVVFAMPLTLQLESHHTSAVVMRLIVLQNQKIIPLNSRIGESKIPSKIATPTKVKVPSPAT